MKRLRPIAAAASLLFSPHSPAPAHTLPYTSNQITPANLYSLQQKIQWDRPGKIQVLETDHFSVYMAEEEEALASRIARIAEEWYPRLEARMGVRYDSLAGGGKKIPLIGYTSSTRFQTTNTSPGFVGEGVQGFFDLIRGRIVIPVTGSNELLEHVIRHEMVHAFTLPLIESSWNRYKADRERVRARRREWSELVYVARRLTKSAPAGSFPRFVKGELTPDEESVGLPPPAYGEGVLHPRIFVAWDEEESRRRKVRLSLRLPGREEAECVLRLSDKEQEAIATALALAAGGVSSVRLLSRENRWTVEAETETLFHHAVPPGGEREQVRRLLESIPAGGPANEEGPGPIRKLAIDLVTLEGVEQDELGEAYRRLDPLYRALARIPYDGPVSERDRRRSLDRYKAAEKELFRYVPPDLRPRLFPLSVMEGVAEYYASDWSDLNDLVLRDLVHEGRLVPFHRLTPWNGYLVYVEGLSFFRFLAEQYGEEKIGQLLQNLYRGYRMNDQFRSVYGVDVEELNQRWEFSLRRRYLSQFPGQKDIREYAVEVEGGRFEGPPRADGGRLLFSSFRRGRTELRLFDESGPRSLARDRLPGFESLHLGDPAIDIAGDRAAFVTLSKGRDEVVILSLEGDKPKVVERRRFDSILTIESLALSPDGERVLIGALGDEGWTDLYRFRIGRDGIERLTADIYHETGVDWGEDGILFTADREAPGKYDLYRIDRVGGETRLLDLDHSIGNPRWRGAEILYLEREGDHPKNVSLFNRTEGTTRPVTQDAVGISAFDVDGDTLYLRTNRSLRFTVWKTSLSALLDSAGPALEREPPGPATPWSLPDPVAFEKGPYKRKYGPDLFYLAGSSFYTASMLGLSDILGDRKISLFLGSNADRTSDLVRYLSGGATVHYLGGRVDYRLGAFHYADEYLTDRRGFFFRRESGVLAGATWPIDRFRSIGANLLVKRVREEPTGTGEGRNSGEVTIQGVLGYDTAVPGPFGYGFGGGVLASLIFSGDIEFTPTRDLRNTTALADFRYYVPIGGGFIWANRASGGLSVGDDPQQILIGGSLTLRGYDFLSLRGDRYLLANEEIRFPFPVRLLVGDAPLVSRLQGALFVDAGDAWFDGRSPLFRGSAGFGLRMGFGGAVLRWDLAKRYERRRFHEGWKSGFFIGWNY